MKISEIKKDYRVFINGLMQKKDEVFTLTEIVELANKNNIPSEKEQIRTFVHGNCPHFTYGRFAYYGHKEALEKAKKAMGVI